MFINLEWTEELCHDIVIDVLPLVHQVQHVLSVQLIKKAKV